MKTDILYTVIGKLAIKFSRKQAWSAVWKKAAKRNRTDLIKETRFIMENYKRQKLGEILNVMFGVEDEK